MTILALVKNALDKTNASYKKSRSEIQHRYYVKHRDRILARDKEWKKQNIERVRAYALKSYYKYREKHNAYSRQYHRDHPEKKKEIDRRYRERHRLEIRLRHGEKDRIRAREWRQNNPEHIRRYENGYRLTLRDKVLDILGAICVKCFEKDRRCLEIDHIFNDGQITRKEFKRVDVEHRYYIKYPDRARERLQVLCANCHLKKHRG